MLQAVSIFEPVREGLERVKERLYAVADVVPSFPAELLDHALEPAGKSFRPAITLLASNFHPRDDEVIETMAVAVELLHIASMIHDDTVDDSDVRRGKATVSSLWGRNAAVLVGDYIFAKSATFVCDTGNIRVVKRFAETIMELSSGELQETADAYNSGQSREQYLKRVYDKTASLFTTAAQSGAVLSGVSEEMAGAFTEYGYNVGMAFQIIDDILDFDGESQEVGKPVGSDLAHGILTLPAIIAVERQPDDNPILDSLEHPGDSLALERAMEMVQSSSAVKDARATAEEYGLRAVNALAGLERNDSRRSLEALVDYALNRRN